MNNTTVNLLGGKLFEFIPYCLGLVDNGNEETQLTISAFGGNTDQAMVLAQILNQTNPPNRQSDCFNAKICETKSYYLAINELKVEFSIDDKNGLVGKNSDEELRSLLEDRFIEFPIYHLLLNNLLKNQGSFKISTSKNEWDDKEKIDLLEVIFQPETEGQLEIGSLTNEEKTKKWNSQVVSSLYRSGYLLPKGWEKIGHRLAKYDDIIIGLDTNVLCDAFISNNLLPIVAVIEKNNFVQTPNWILMVIPQMVVYELEMASNIKHDNGRFRHAGRIGFRALQEIMELRNNFDHKGVSVANTGESNSFSDFNSFLKSINDNLFELVNSQSRDYRDNRNNRDNRDRKGSKSPKSTSADMLIRTQYKSFVDEINFTKGSYFITSDKVNAAMHTAQGSQAIYISKPSSLENRIIRPPELVIGKKRAIPLGKLIYELIVEFGTIYLDLNDGTSIRLECDNLGKSLDPWTKKSIRIPSEVQFNKLVNSYNGKFNLLKTRDFYRSISRVLEQNEWSSHEEEDCQKDSQLGNWMD